MATTPLLIQRRAEAVNQMSKNLQEIGGLLGIDLKPLDKKKFPDVLHEQVARIEWLNETLVSIKQAITQAPPEEQLLDDLVVATERREQQREPLLKDEMDLPEQAEGSKPFPRSGRVLGDLHDNPTFEPRESADKEDQEGMSQANSEPEPVYFDKPLSWFRGKNDKELKAIKGVGKTILKKIKEDLEHYFPDDADPNSEAAQATPVM